MEETTISAKKYILIYGLILGMIFIVYNIFMYLGDEQINKIRLLSILYYIINIGVIILGIKLFKKANNGFLRLGEALKIGVGIALIAGLMVIFWNIVLNTVIEPDMMSEKLLTQKQQMIEQNPNVSKKEIEQRMATVERFSSLYFTSAINLIIDVIFGLIISLLAGAIMQKERDIFD